MVSIKSLLTALFVSTALAAPMAAPAQTEAITVADPGVTAAAELNVAEKRDVAYVATSYSTVVVAVDGCTTTPVAVVVLVTSTVYNGGWADFTSTTTIGIGSVAGSTYYEACGCYVTTYEGGWVNTWVDTATVATAVVTTSTATAIVTGTVTTATQTVGETTTTAAAEVTGTSRTVYVTTDADGTTYTTTSYITGTKDFTPTGYEWVTLTTDGYTTSYITTYRTSDTVTDVSRDTTLFGGANSLRPSLWHGDEGFSFNYKLILCGLVPIFMTFML